MTSTSLSSPRSIRQQVSPQQLVTRHNAVMFYGVAAASLLEGGIAQRAHALAAAFAPDAAFCAWVRDSWIPSKSAHAGRTRAYVDTMWPEFDWSAADDDFSTHYRRLAPCGRSNRGLARTALVFSTAAAQAAICYRALGAVADDPDLRRLLHELAADEVAHFECFRRCYEGHRRRERLGMLESFRAVVACASRARDLDVQLAFNSLNGHHWYGSVPVQDLSYREFVARMANMVRQRLPLRPAQRLLFKPWLNARDVPTLAVPRNPVLVNPNGRDRSRLAAGT
jgi:hypothetical protein